MAKITTKTYDLEDKVQVDLINILPSMSKDANYIRHMNLPTVVEGIIKNINSNYYNVHLDVKDCERKIAQIHSKLSSSLGLRPLRDAIGEDYHNFHAAGWKISIPESVIINSPVKRVPSMAVYKDNEYKVIAREICNKRYYDLIDKEGNKFKTVPKKDRNLKFKQENVNTK